MSNCPFCKLVDQRSRPDSVVFSDPWAIAVKARDPVAPTHLLIIPVEHFANLNELREVSNAAELIGHMVAAAVTLAEKHHLLLGYRLVFNCGPDGGQTVQHVHLHLIGGQPLGPICGEGKA